MATMRFKISHHRHTGRALPHHHTSYAALAFLMMFTGVILASVTTISRGATGSTNISATVQGPPPAVGAYITSPVNNYETNTSPIAISGTCPADLLVRVFRNSVFAGSTFCQTDGTFSLLASLITGLNSMTAIDYDGLDQAGPATPAVNVYYQSPAPSPPPPPPSPGPPPPPPPPPPSLVITTDQSFMQADPGENLTWTGELQGGVPPYAISWNWGDGDTSLLPLSSPGSFSIDHTYDTPGTYDIIARASDASGQEAVLQLGARVNGTPPVVNNSNQDPKPSVGLVGGAVRAVQSAVQAAIAPVATAINDSLIVPVVEGTKRVIRETPAPVAYSFPYLLFLGLAIIIFLVSAQAYREVVQSELLLSAVKREKSIAEEKDNFIMLSSHYLRTPLTIMKNGIELAASMHKISDTMNTLLKAGIEELGQRIEAMLNTINNDSILKSIKAPDVTEAKVRAFASPFLLLPLIFVGGLTIVSNVLFVRVASINISTLNFLLQALVFIGVAIVLYMALRSRLIKKQNLENSKKLLNYQYAIDIARNEFIRNSVVKLSDELETLGQSLAGISSDKDAMHVLAGYENLRAMITKFEWIARLEHGQLEAKKEEFFLGGLMSGVMQRHSSAVANKNLIVSVDGANFTVHQNREMLDFIINSVVDNAIKFSDKLGKVEVGYKLNGTIAEVTVTDHGPGMSDEEIKRLFQPFTRADSALVFNEEGMGFSLYLDKVMLNYLEGTIELSSSPGTGTKVTLRIPAYSAEAVAEDMAAAPVAIKAHHASPVMIGGVILLIVATTVLVAGAYRVQGFDNVAIAWPLYAIAAIMLVSFWLGEVYQKARLSLKSTEL